MPKTRCTVCESTIAVAVNDQLAAGKSVRSLAQVFDLSRSTLGRHAAHANVDRPAARAATGKFAATTSERPDTQGRNRIAADATITALRSAGRLELIDSARIAMLQTLADGVDADPVNATLWREYRAAETALREVTDDGTDELAEILSRLSTAVGDAEDKNRNES
jgi:hypothetical protein